MMNKNNAHSSAQGQPKKHRLKGGLCAAFAAAVLLGGCSGGDVAPDVSRLQPPDPQTLTVRGKEPSALAVFNAKALRAANDNDDPFASDWNTVLQNQAAWSQDPQYNAPYNSYVQAVRQYAGDCKDQAVLQYFLMRSLGVPARRLFVADVDAGRSYKGNYADHAVLLVNVAPAGKPQSFVVMNDSGNVYPAARYEKNWFFERPFEWASDKYVLFQARNQAGLLEDEADGELFRVARAAALAAVKNCRTSGGERRGFYG